MKNIEKQFFLMKYLKVKKIEIYIEFLLNELNKKFDFFMHL